MLGQFSDPLLRECHTLLAFKVERLSDDSNGQDTQIFCHFSDDWCCTCTGTATHTRCDECHFCSIVEHVLDIFKSLFGSLACLGRFVSCTQTFLA